MVCLSEMEDGMSVVDILNRGLKLIEVEMDGFDRIRNQPWRV